MCPSEQICKHVLQLFDTWSSTISADQKLIVYSKTIVSYDNDRLFLFPDLKVTVMLQPALCSCACHLEAKAVDAEDCLACL